MSSDIPLTTAPQLITTKACSTSVRHCTSKQHSSLIAATPKAAAMDGRTDGSDGPLSEAGGGTQQAAARQRDVSKF